MLKTHSHNFMSQTLYHNVIHIGVYMQNGRALPVHLHLHLLPFYLLHNLYVYVFVCVCWDPNLAKETSSFVPLLYSSQGPGFN